MSKTGLRPDEAELVDVGRQVFVDELLPLLPADKRLAGLMVANALGIALRMIRSDGIEGSDEVDVVHQCARFRAGTFDSDDDGRLRAHLIRRTLARLAISAPKALLAAERDLGHEI